MKLGPVPGGDATLLETLGTVEHVVTPAVHDVGGGVAQLRGTGGGHPALADFAAVANRHAEGTGDERQRGGDQTGGAQLHAGFLYAWLMSLASW